MGLVIPARTETDYPTSIQTTLTKMDAHDHSSGKGVLIGPTALRDGGISTTAIADDAISAEHLDASVVDNSTVDQDGSGAIRLKDLGITTAKFPDGAVTQAKLATKTVQSDTGSNPEFFNSTSYADTTAAVTITTTGRPVLICAGVGIASGASGTGYIGNGTGATTVAIFRDSTQVRAGTSWNTVSSKRSWSCTTIDTPSAGTYTYKVRCKVNGSGNCNISYPFIQAVEL
jgi:hypothetical protein